MNGVSKRIVLSAVLCGVFSGCSSTAEKTFECGMSAYTKFVRTSAIAESRSRSLELPQNSSEPERNPDIPWGFDEASYTLYQSGRFSHFIPSGSEVDQCISADLNMDGILDALLTVSIPETVDPNIAIQDYGLNTLILKGLGDGIFELAAENRDINYFSSYDCSAETTAGTGWFKLTRARGTAGGYEYNYLFRYDTEKSDWIFSEYYSNNGGFVDYGTAIIQTKENFGKITFQDFKSDDLWGWGTEDKPPLNSLSVDKEGFSVSVSPCYVTLQDEETEHKVNQLIANDLTYFIDNLRELQVNVDISLFGHPTFVSPEVISIAYQVFGTIDSEELNFSGVNRKYFTTTIDIKNAERITLSDIIDIQKLNQVIQENGFSEVSILQSERTRTAYDKLNEGARLNLLAESDSLDGVFGTESSSIFCALHEKSICLYFQPDFFGMGPESEEPMLFIPIEDLLPYVKVPYWDTPSQAATHIVWQG